MRHLQVILFLAVASILVECISIPDHVFYSKEEIISTDRIEEISEISQKSFIALRNQDYRKSSRSLNTVILYTPDYFAYEAEVVQEVANEPEWSENYYFVSQQIDLSSFEITFSSPNLENKQARHEGPYPYQNLLDQIDYSEEYTNLGTASNDITLAVIELDNRIRTIGSIEAAIIENTGDFNAELFKQKIRDEISAFENELIFNSQLILPELLFEKTSAIQQNLDELVSMAEQSIPQVSISGRQESGFWCNVWTYTKRVVAIIAAATIIGGMAYAGATLGAVICVGNPYCVGAGLLAGTIAGVYVGGHVYQLIDDL